MATLKMASRIIYFSSVILFYVVCCQSLIVERDSDTQTNVGEKDRVTDNDVNLKENYEESDWLEEEADPLSDSEDQIIVDNELRNVENYVDRSNSQSHTEYDKLPSPNDILEEERPTDSSRDYSDMLNEKALGSLAISRNKNMMTIPEDERKDRHKTQCPKQVNDKFNSERKLITLLTEQLNIVEKFLNYTNVGKDIERQRKSDFDDLLDTIKNKPSTVRTTTTVTEEQTEMATDMTIIDEVEVRRALKKDPLVKRLLNIAKMKRNKYLTQKATN